MWKLTKTEQKWLNYLCEACSRAPVDMRKQMNGPPRW